MNLLLDTISRLGVEWNKRPLTEHDFHRLCRKFKVMVDEMPLSVSGFYYSVHRRHFIAIDSKLPPHKKLFVMFHEFAHFLFHVPDTGATANFHGVGRKTRKEAEADAFALCALMPLNWLESERFSELAEEAGFDVVIVRERLAIFDRFGL